MIKNITFKRYILNELMRNGYMTLDTAYSIGQSMYGMKQKTVERELNPSRSPLIETHKVDGIIKGYKWRTFTPTQTQEDRLLQQAIM